MKTPFCIAITIRKREVDESRRAIAKAAAVLASFDAQVGSLDRAAVSERGIASGDWTLGGAQYFRRLGEQRVALRAARTVAAEGLAGLRDSAAEAFARLSAIEEAADRWRSDEQRRVDAVEQSASDDRSAAGHARQTAALRFAKRAA